MLTMGKPFRLRGVSSPEIWPAAEAEPPLLAQAMVPCTPRGVIELLQENGIEIKGKKAVVLGRSRAASFFSRKTEFT